MPDKDNFKLFSSIIKDNKTCPTEAERLVQETPYVTKEGNLFNTGLTLIDRAFYKPKENNVEELLNRLESSETNSAHEEHNKTYTKYEFINTTINKVEDFFEDVRYDVNLGNVSMTKSINNEIDIQTNVDFIGNVGMSFNRHYSATQLETAIQYKPSQKESRISVNYSDKVNGVSTSIYVNDYNPGIMSGYTRHFEGNKSIGAGASVFKEETNLYVKYKQNNTAVALYGSVKKPFVGVCARITY